MIYILLSFIFGAFIPYMARRFSKFMPATMAYALYRLIAPTKKVSKQKRQSNGRYLALMQKYMMRSVGWAVVSSALAATAHFCLPSAFYIILILGLLLLYEIDERMFLLPDLLTVPLLIIGFLFASTQETLSTLSPFSPAFQSAVGALAGYMLPVIASLVIVKKHPEAFGGGDIKLLSAVGAWIGFEYIPALLLLSSLLFGLFCFIKHERAGAFGPSIVIATLVLVFFIHLV